MRNTFKPVSQPKLEILSRTVSQNKNMGAGLEGHEELRTQSWQESMK